MIYEIPITPTHPSFTQESALDGTTYQFLFRWNTREEAWYLTLSDLEGEVVAAGLKLVPGASLLRHLVDFSTRPLGALFVEGGPPTRTSLGTEARLVYFDAAEAA